MGSLKYPGMHLKLLTLPILLCLNNHYHHNNNSNRNMVIRVTRGVTTRHSKAITLLRRLPTLDLLGPILLDHYLRSRSRNSLPIRKHHTLRSLGTAIHLPGLLMEGRHSNRLVPIRLRKTTRLLPPCVPRYPPLRKPRHPLSAISPVISPPAISDRMQMYCARR
jgi:hypothetical protein